MRGESSKEGFPPVSWKMKRFVLALQFLTVFTVKRGVEASREEISGSMAYFPLVGAVQGLILVAADYVLGEFLPGGIVSALLVLILLVTNGGLHLDGFADTVDGLAGGREREERLRIMRTGTVGALGVAFTVLLLLLKYLSLDALASGYRAGVLFLFPVIGRWAMVPLSYWSVYARPTGGIGEAFTGAGLSTLLISTAFTAVLSVFILGMPGVFLLTFLGAAAFLFSVLFHWKLGGVTGDVFGFCSEVSEVIFLLMVIALI